MEQNFNQYLNEMKEKNLYSTDIKSDFLNEGLFGIGKKKARPCVSAIIDFTTEKFINNIAELITDDELKDDTKREEKITEKVANYINKINIAFKNTTGHLFVRGLDNGALKYYFKMYSKRDPEGNINDFKSRIDKDLELSFIKNNMTVKDDTYSNIEVSNLKNDPNELNKVVTKPTTDDGKLDLTDLKKSIFVKNIVKKISGSIKTRKEKLDNATKNGELKQVYCVPFKISDTLINSVKEKADSEDEFWKGIVEKVNTDLKNALKNTGDAIKEYIGLVPIKAYGFNIYFKDRDAAEQFAEQLTQEGDTKISERQRYEKKIANYVQILEETPVNINGIDLQPREAGISMVGGKKEGLGPQLYFQSTLFAREKIAPAIKDKFDNATLIPTNRYTFKITKDIINTILQDVDIKNLTLPTPDSDADKMMDDKNDHTQFDAIKVYKYIYETLIKYCLSENKTFIGAGSTDNAQFELYFTTNASAEYVKNLISQHLNINKEKDITIQQVALTREEIDKVKQEMKSEKYAAKKFLSFIREIENNSEHNEIEVKVLELTLTDAVKNDLIKKKNEPDDRVYSKTVTALANSIEDKLKKINTFIGFTFDKDYKAIVYFKDESGVNSAKEMYRSDSEFNIGNESTTKLSNTELEKIKSTHSTYGIDQSADKSIAEQKYKWYIKEKIDFTMTVEEFIKKAEALNEISVILESTFKSTLFNYLMNNTGIITEAKTYLNNYNKLKNMDNKDTVKLNSNEDYINCARQYVVYTIKAKFTDIVRNYDVGYAEGENVNDLIATVICGNNIVNKLYDKVLKPLNNTGLVNIIKAD